MTTLLQISSSSHINLDIMLLKLREEVNSPNIVLNEEADLNENHSTNNALW